MQSLYWRHKLSVSRLDQPWLLCLQDPADMTNDLCKGVYRILDIQRTLGYLANDLDEWLNGDTAKHQSPGHTVQSSPLNRFFGWHLAVTRDHRLALTRWGLALPKKMKPNDDSMLDSQDLQSSEADLQGTDNDIGLPPTAEPPHEEGPTTGS